jgi:hypothetical protein
MRIFTTEDAEPFTADAEDLHRQFNGRGPRGRGAPRYARSSREELGVDCRLCAPLPLDVKRLFPDVQAERLSAEHADIVHPAFDAYVRASRRRSRVLRHHRHIAAPIVHAVHTERHERQTPRTGDDSVDADSAILPASGVAADFGDTRRMKAHCAPRCRDHEREGGDEA